MRQWIVRRPAAALLAALAVSGCAGARGAGSALSPLGARGFGDDRVLVGRASEIAGVAVSQRYVYALTDEAILVLDRQLERWLPPLAPRRGAGARPTVLAGDPMDDGVWVGEFGAVTYYRPQLDVGSSAIVAGVPDVIMFDARDPGAGAFVRASGAWSLVTRTGFASAVDARRLPPAGARILPPTLEELYRRYPSLQSFGAMLTRDASLRTWPVSAGARAPEREEVWLGTWGNGIYRVDPLFNRAEHFPFGLMERGAGALAPAADGVWIAGLGLDARARGGLVFASRDLQRWRWIEPAVSNPLLGARAYDAATRGDAAWIATDRGLVRLALRGEGARLWRLGAGLPDDRALAVVPREGGAWVGTARGLAFVSDSGAGGAGEALLPGVAVRALAARGDTLWIGSDAGLLVLPRGEAAPRRVGAEPRLARPVSALALADSEVVAAVDGDILRVAARDGRVLPRWPALPLGGIGDIGAMAMDERTLWLAGRAGVVVVSRADGVARALGVPAELPAEPYDVLLDGDLAWIATRAGVVRLRRLPDGFPR